MFVDAGGAREQLGSVSACFWVSSVDAPPHDRHRGQQTNQRARCRGGGGVTQVGVAALEGKTGHLWEHLAQSAVLTV